MSTAQGFYEVYKALPKKVQQEVKRLIESEETIDISLSALNESIEQVKLLKKGKAETRPLSELITELKNG
ncbi:hypothetical protein [Runella aurantiaca]|uniref:Uncharacterized protein n=1 Tax=Runella aurantiaca TaxID=2282308 RepID=A0A369I9U3_9BACT|nr:hypothetical protein [Runella aurantiaca]RDB06529.1 hypothetical protein DVG78_07230 [Runella aurantiaca]